LGEQNNLATQFSDKVAELSALMLKIEVDEPLARKKK